MLEVFFLHLILVIFPASQLPPDPPEVAPPPRIAKFEPVTIQRIENGVLALKDDDNAKIELVQTPKGPRIRVTTDAFTLEATQIDMLLPPRLMDKFNIDPPPPRVTITQIYYIKDGRIWIRSPSDSEK